MGRVVALIPARGGSKGLPGKNIALLAGKPMIHYTIQAALACPLVDAVYVSTDDPDIARVAQECGSQLAPLRPPELATDTTPTVAVVQHFLDWHENQKGPVETLVLLQPTSPLRTTVHVTEALLLYNSLQTQGSVVSIAPAKPLAWQAHLNESGCLAFHHNQTEVNRQAQMPNYQLNGAIYIASPARYRANALLAKSVYPYVMPAQASVDIDDAFDFRLAEFLLKQSHATEAALV